MSKLSQFLHCVLLLNLNGDQEEALPMWITRPKTRESNDSVRIRVGRFLPEGRKKRFFHGKNRSGKIHFAGKNRFMPELSSK